MRTLMKILATMLVKSSTQRKLAVGLTLPLWLLISSCTTNLNDYAQTTPKLNIKQYFNGPLIAWGMVQNHQQKLTRRFCVELTGTWQGDEGVLAETFYFHDGEISYRNWQLTQTKVNHFEGHAEDVVGTAFGQQVGAAFQWQYQLLVPVSDKTYQLTLDDWMYQLDEHRVFNRTKMKKFGVTVAEITLFFDKQNPNKTCSANPLLSTLI